MAEASATSTKSTLDRLLDLPNEILVKICAYWLYESPRLVPLHTYHRHETFNKALPHLHRCLADAQEQKLRSNITQDIKDLAGEPTCHVVQLKDIMWREDGHFDMGAELDTHTIEHIWFCNEEWHTVQGFEGPVEVPMSKTSVKAFLTSIQHILERLPHLQRFEIEWDTEVEDYLLRDWEYWYNEPSMVGQLQATSYGLITGEHRKDSGLWDVKVFDRRGGSRYRWLMGKVDGVEPVNVWWSDQVNVLPVLEEAAVPYPESLAWFQ